MLSVKIFLISLFPFCKANQLYSGHFLNIIILIKMFAECDPYAQCGLESCPQTDSAVRAVFSNSLSEAHLSSWTFRIATVNMHVVELHSWVASEYTSV